MRKLKYIKLFEAFDSVKLSRTLSYIKDDKSFLSGLKRICSLYDFPISKLNDDLFEYLPYRKALARHEAISDIPCDSTSIDNFGEMGISGESCDGTGKLKRKWGERERIVSCPGCNGTGVKQVKNAPMKLLKFWFTKEGESVGITGVDGNIRNNSELSDNIEDYIIGSNIPKRKLDEIDTGNYLMLNYKSYYNKYEDVICYVIRQNDSLYGIQNKIDGHSPWGHNWENIAKYSFGIYKEEVSNVRLLIPKDKKVDDYSLNVGVDVGYYNIRPEARIDVKNLLKNANFALVLDLGKLEKMGYKKVSHIKKERTERKSGSKLELTDDLVRNKNIERYFDKLSKNLNISENAKDISRMLKKALGYKKNFFIIFGDAGIVGDIKGIIEKYLEVLKAPKENKEEIEYYTNSLNNRVERRVKLSSERSKNINDNIMYIKSNIEVGSNEHKLILELEEISSIIYNNIFNKLDLDSIEDMEVFLQKINSYKEVFSSYRYSIRHVYRLCYLMIDDNKESLFDELTDRYRIQDNIESILSEMDRVKKIIYKL
jgi:hypothetical protein